MYKSNLAKVERGLDTLSTTGLGRRTPDFQMLDNEKESHCAEGICEIHLIQVFLDNAYPGYHTKAIPQKLGNKFIISVDHFLCSVNTTLYIPLEDTIKLGANTYVFPHLPDKKKQHTSFAMLKLTVIIQDMESYNFILCRPKTKIATCR